VVIQDADLEYSPEEYPELIELICSGRADVVYGSRFLGRHRVFLFSHYLGNRLLTLLTNVLYNTMLTDMETCFKSMRVAVVRSMTLRSNRFGIEPELTAKIFKGGYRVYEIPITYDGRGYDDARRSRGVTAYPRSDAVEIPVRRLMPHPLKRLFGYSKPYRWRLGGAVVAMAVYAAGDAGQAILVKPIVDRTLLFGDSLAVMAWGIVGVYVLKGIGSYVSSYVMIGVGQRVVMDLRNALYRHILGQSAGFFAQRTTGQLMSRIGNDVGQQQAVSETIGDLARESITAVVLAGYLLYIDPRLTLSCLIVAPLIVYPLVRLGWRVRRTTRRSQEALEQLSHLTVEAFTGHRIVKARSGPKRTRVTSSDVPPTTAYRTNMKVTAAPRACRR
jgi:hypothetical protein